jgi:membrane associated rhomboid family serine protease
MYFWFFFPLGLDLSRRRAPWVSLLVVGLMVAVFAWSRWWPGALAVHPWELVYHVGGGRPWTVATAWLLHADWLHLLGNLVYLVAFLPVLEDRLSRLALAMLLVACGVGGNLCHGIAAWNGWLGQGGLGILGASGAISGLLGYALVRVPHARVRVAYWVLAPLQGQNRAGRANLPLPAAVLVWLLLQVVNALVAGETGSTVSYPAHLGGFAVGLVMAVLLGGVGEARSETHLARARRHLERGDAWPAVGEYTDYLQDAPGDLAARVERARALLLADARPRAVDAYRDVYRRAVAVGDWDRALSTLAEGRHLTPGLALAPDEQAAAAQQADRAGRLDEAVRIYQDLVGRGLRHPAVDRAWVRLVLLLHARPETRAEAHDWLEAARRELPPGAWRDHLEREFRSRAAPRGERSPGGAIPTPARGS